MEKLKRILKNWRYYIIVAGAAVVVTLLLCEPSQDASWARVFVLSKVAGFASLFLLLYLCSWWNERGEIDELTEMLKEEDGKW